MNGLRLNRLQLAGHPLRRAWWASTGRALWYLLAYQVMGWLLFGAALVAVTAAAAVSITLAGIPLLVAAAGVIHACAGAERSRLAAVTGVPVEHRYREPDQVPPGLIARARAYWTDPATWREFAYLVGMFVPLVVLGCVVLAVWLTLAAGVTLPLWYWAPFDHFSHGVTVHGVQLGYFPNGPSGSGAVGVYVDTLPKALLTALVCLLLLVPFSYLLVLTARTHATVARTLLRPPEDPLAQAKDLLQRPGPLPSLIGRTDRPSSPTHEGPAHGWGHEPTARTR
jgi:Putative sensor